MTRERYADEPDPGPLLVCHRPPCAGRVYHDQAMHDFLAHRYNVPINLDHPLAALVAGRIDQATYRRRMADLERRAADSLDAEPEPARRRRRPEPDRSGTVIVWLAVALAGVLLWIAIAGIVVHLAAAPRTTHQPTVELGSSAGTTAGAGDTSLTVNLGASAVGSSGAPLDLLSSTEARETT